MGPGRSLWTPGRASEAGSKPARFTEQAVLGLGEDGAKQVLGLWQGATESAAVAKGLLEDLVERGLDRARRYLLALEGCKPPRAGVEHASLLVASSRTLSDFCALPPALVLMCLGSRLPSPGPERGCLGLI